MNVRHTEFLDLATAAVSRGDYLSAWQYGLRAAGAPTDRHEVRCDAHMVLATTSLQLGDDEVALAYAVGAHLEACRIGDHLREEKASAIVAMVVAQHPHLRDDKPESLHWS
ncbi:MAG: hypothetical protein K0R39_2432 [Symbiobacteriaceae bacterium]|jgi:hypothetical protein|nr:hypothetical protein [Symbiobacteriaceae bacterium]